ICERRQVFWPEDWFHHDRPLSSLTVGLAATGPRLGPGRRLLLDGELPLGTEATDNRLVGGDRRPRPLIDRLDRHTSALRRLRVLVPRRLRLLVVGREPGRVDRPAGRELDEVRDHVVLEQVPLLAGPVHDRRLGGPLELDGGGKTPRKPGVPVAHKALSVTSFLGANPTGNG